MKHIRIGSRESRLAVIQAEIVKAAILEHDPECIVEIVTMKTTGDKILDKSLAAIGGKGLFVKELDQALLSGQTDLSVHSLKDMPMEVPEELPILAYSKREDPRDAVIYAVPAAGLVAGAVIGTSSKRRQMQLKKLYPDCHVESIRGNVQTRLQKLQTEKYDATVLAVAGLNRLGFGGQIGRILGIDEMIPAAGQGILAIQGRAGEDLDWLSFLNDPESEAAARAERSFVRALGGSCTSPIAAYASLKNQELALHAWIADDNMSCDVAGERTGCAGQAEEIGQELAFELKERLNRH